MKEQFMPYELALKLKEKGFMEECFGFYYYDASFKKYRLVYEESSNDYLNSINAPLWQQVIDWFEDKFNLKFSIAYWNGYSDSLPKEMQYKYEVYIVPENARSIAVRDEQECYLFDNRKDAVLAAIIKALTLI